MLRSLVNLNPVAELQQVADMMDRAFSEFRENVNSEQPRGWSLPVDIFERDNNLVIKAAVPGVKPEDIDVSVENNVLTIRGESKEETQQNDVVYRREYRYGSFSRSIRLPENIDTNGIEAEFDHGFVKIILPRVEPAKPKALKVQVKNASVDTKAFESGKERAKEKNASEKASVK